LGIDNLKYQKNRAFTNGEYKLEPVLDYITMILRKKKIIVLIRVLILWIKTIWIERE